MIGVMRICCTAIALVLLMGAAEGQDLRGSANPSLQASVNGIRDAAHARALTLRRLDVAVDIRGAVAETTVVAAFANPLSETLEGDFRFSLPTGAIVTGYALDVNGTMVDGVLVDRPRAKAVYEQRVRRGVDPGVAEVMPDGTFQTRIFPILPGNGRTIRVRFVSAIAPATGYRLSLGAAPPTQGWSITVHASGVSAAPAVTLPDGRTLTMAASADGYQGKRENKAAEPAVLDGALVIASSAMPDLVASAHRNGERDVQIGGVLPSGNGAKVGRLRIYWDRSRSRLDGHSEAEIALLRRYIETVRPSMIELVAFNSSGADRRTVRGGAEAEAWAKGISYRGATSFASIASDQPADRCLLFGDGPPTIDHAQDFPSCPLDVVTASSVADETWLRHLATSRGGHFHWLTDGAIDSVLHALVEAGPAVVAVRDRDGRALPFLTLEAPAGRWLVLARVREGEPVTVRLAGGGTSVDQRVVNDGEAVPFDGAASLIASDALATLGATEQRAEFVALSRRYGIASPSLSFLVLETPVDYLTAHIEPPTNYPAQLRDAYFSMRKAQEGQRGEEQQARLQRVVKDWAEQVTWWKTRFDPAARPARIATSQAFDETGRVSAPLPPPPPPPSPSVAVPASPPDFSDVVVTAQRRSGAQGEESSRPDIVPTAAASKSIQIDAWQPDRPYIELYDGKPEAFDERFLEAQRRHGGLPIFYLDTAEWLRKRGRIADAIEMVLSALDLPTANDVTLGIVADRLERYGQIDRAIELRERQAVLDPDRPQLQRFLALALAKRAALQPTRAKEDLSRAVRLLGDTAVAPWSGNWDGIDMIALMEANALIPKLRQLGGSPDLDSRLVALLDVDIRVVVDWTTDATDLDLWVDEPTRERAIYNNPRTVIGGHLSNDMTAGYGPEEYLLRRAPSGTYTVQANVFSSDRIDPNGASVLTAHLFRNFGRPNQQEEVVDIELKRDENGAKMIGRIGIGAASSKR